MKRKKILIITYYFPPSASIATHRLLAFAKYLPQLGWDPIFYIPENPSYPSVAKNTPIPNEESIEIIKGEIWEPFELYKRLTGSSKSQKVPDGLIKDKPTGLMKKLSFWIRANFFIPDARMFWIKPSQKQLTQYLKSNQVNAILSCGTPHSVHLIAQKLQTTFGLKWVADFRDPWSKIDYFEYLPLTSLALKKHLTLEKDVLTKADLVTTVSPSWAKDFQNQGARTAVITNGFEPAIFDGLIRERNRDNYTIAHIGTLNSDRNMPVLWQTLRTIISNLEQPIKLKLIGNVSDYIKQQIKLFQLETICEFTGSISHQAACQEMLNADLLLLPINQTNDEQGRIPAKVFEYLAAKTPILMLGKTSSDCADIIKKTSSGIAIDYNDQNKLHQFLTHQLSTPKTLSSFEFTNIAQYSRANQTEKLVKLLNQLTPPTNDQ